jgi:sterol desaturase/sphingolipid hydroxylase (fatty acid hydroxylase superfamily)
VELFQATANEIARVYLIYLGLIVAELLLPARRQRLVRDRLFNIGQSLIVLPLLIAVLIPAMHAAVAPVKQWAAVWVPIRADAVVGYVGVFGAGLLYLLVYDFFYYWFHRWEHRYPWMWAMHRIHHSDPAVNVTTTFRVHWIEEPFRLIFLHWPLALVTNLTPVEGGAYGFVLGLWIFVIHANIRLSLGPLSWLVAAPQVHRIHHSIEPRHIDRNFAAFFPVWDVLFGTYYHPRRDEYPATGLVGADERETLAQANLYPFALWLGSARRLQRPA